MAANSIVFSFIFLNLFFKCGRFEAIQPSEKLLNDGKGSLVFVFDTTGSMFNDLRQLREGAELILQTAMEESNIIADFVFVPFHDPGVGPATVTKDKEVFKKALASVGRVYGGGNCPEMTLKGIQLALNVSRPRSFLYVFTDASAYDHKLVGKVLDAVQRKQSQVVFVLTGHCNDLDKPTYRVYHQIATASSGQIFNLNKTSVHKVLDFVRSSIKGRTVNLASAVNPPGYNYTQEIPVDTSVGEVTVSVSGAKPQIRVVSPSGEELTGPPRLVTTLDLSEIMIVKVLKPEPGNWSITVGSEEEHSVRVVGLSNLTFQQGFSVQPSTSMVETSYRPLKGTYNHMLITLNGADVPLHMDQVQLLSMDGKPMFEVPLKEVDKELKIYQADAFIPPDEFFNVAIVGRDENGQEIRRLGSTAVQAKPPDSPYLLVTKKIEARAHTQVKLTCRVESLVPLSAVWTKDGEQLQSKTQALQSTSIEYVIEDMVEENVGTYECVASNAAGASKATTVLNMIVEPPRVTLSPINLTLIENDTLTLVCSVLSEALLKRTQIVFNGTLNNYATNYDLEPSIDGYYVFNQKIQNVSEKDSGVYTCVASNRGGTANESSYITVQLQPKARIVGEHTLTKHIHSDIQITCAVENAAKVQWLDLNNNVVKEYEVNGSYSAMLDIKNVTEDGVWTCVAINNALKDTSAELYSQIDFHCLIDSDPLPNITWYHNGTTLNTDNINISDDNTIINIQKVDFNDLGLYACEADNGYEKMTVTGTLSVIGLERPVISKEIDKISTIQGESAIMTCRVLKSKPEPNIKWEFKPKLSNNFTSLPQNIEIDEENGIRIEKVRKQNAGVYKCTAENIIGSDVYDVELSVQYPPEFNVPQDTHSELEDPKEVKVGEKIQLECNVTGIPPPIITWTKDGFPVIYSRNRYLSDDNSLVIENVTRFDSGMYACNASSTLGFVLKNFTITAYQSPEIVQYGKPETEVIEGRLIELPCSTQGVPTPELKWLQNGQVITEARKYIDEYGLRFVANVSDFGVYTCLSTNGYGNASVNYTVLIWVPPSIEPPLEVFVDVQSGANVSVECNAVGFPVPTIAWAFQGDILNYNTTDLSFNDYGNLNLTNATIKKEGSYDCIAENIAGTAKKTFYVSVKEPPRILEDNSTRPRVALSSGTALVISCKADGHPKPYIAWVKDGFYLDTDSRYVIGLDATLTIKSPTEDLSGVYTCVAKNSAGNATMDIPVNVYSVPVLMQDEGFPAVTAAVEGRDVILECPVRGIDYTVKWYKDTLLISNGSLNFPNVSRTNESTYSCVANNAAGSVCATVALQVQWPPNFLTTSNDSIEVVKEDDYTLDCKTDAKPRAKTKWLFNSKLLLGEDKNELKLYNLSLKHSGVYKCIAYNVHGTRQKQYNLSVLEPPFISEFELLDVQLKAAVNATLECNARGTPTPTISWIFNNTNWIVHNSTLTSTNISTQSEGSFRCEARNQAGVAHLVYRVLVVSGAKIEDIVMFKDGVGIDVNKSLDLVLNTNVRLACNASGSPQPIIQWIKHGNTISENTDGVNYADLMLNNISTSHAGPYSCIASNEGGIEERSIKVNVLDPPRIFQTLFHNANTSQNLIELEVISGQAFYLHCHPYGNPPPEIYWFKDGLPLKLYDDTMVSKEFGEVLVSRRAKYDQSGNYTCVARNKVGETSVVFLVDVLVPPPMHKDKVKQASSLQGETLNLTCPAEGSPMPFVMWLKHPYTEISEGERIHLLNDNYTLIIPKPEVSDSGKYSCIMSNKVGTTELVYDVTIETPASIVGNVGNDTTEDLVVPLRRSVVLKCEVEGNPPPNITWFKDIQQLSNSLPNIQRVLGNSLIGLWSVNVGDAGQYICVAENSVGTAHRRYNLAVQVPGKWSAWSSWSFCNETCGVGYQHRTRVCQYIDDYNNTIDKDSQPDKLILDESACKGQRIARRTCNMPPCEEDDTTSKWSSWSKWSRCSVSCGSGTQARSRRCRGRAPCGGDNVQIRRCPGLPKCRVNRRHSDEMPEDFSDNIDPEYIPEATIEMSSESPERLDAKISTEIDDDFYIPSGLMHSFYKVNVTKNLDGSEMGPCDPGYTHNVTNDTCSDIDECLLDSNQCHLTQVCANSPGGYTCSCPEGYASLGAGQRCLDINECTLDTHGCEYACVNVAGGYVCACPALMRLHPDRHRCVTPSMYRKPNSYEDLEVEDYLSTSFE